MSAVADTTVLSQVGRHAVVRGLAGEFGKLNGFSVAVSPFFTAIDGGAFVSLSTWVITKCHSVETHS